MITEVERILIDKDIDYHNKGKDLLVSCFNPEHEDENPSMRIDREAGHFHCFGCGYKGNIFTRFNQYRNIFSARVTNTMNTIRELRKSSWGGYEMPVDAYYLNEMFRGIPAHIMTKFNVITTEAMGMKDRVVFPITDNRGIIVGFQGRYKNSNASPKYLAYPAGISLPWFPCAQHIKPIGNSIILTEGLIDTLFLHGKGLTNAVSIFGTKSVTQDRVLELLTPFILLGIQKVYILMDGDSAGRVASENIKRMIRNVTNLLVESIPLEPGMDPAELSDNYVGGLIKYLHNS